MSRYTDYKYASGVLKGIENKPEKYLIIHYSCESFYNLGGKAPELHQYPFVNSIMLKRITFQFINTLKCYTFLSQMRITELSKKNC